MFSQSDNNPIPIYENPSIERFREEIYQQRRPCLLRGVPLGTCMDQWDATYLSEQLEDQPVQVHVCKSPNMDFINRNFAYKTLPFHEFVRRAETSGGLDEYFVDPNEKYYLRSLGSNVRKDVSNIQLQFPQIAADLSIPCFYPKEKFFSSVFRIASPMCRLWTHYDVMDNILVQIKGRKRVVLFPPTECEKLYMQGDKSKVLNIDNPDEDEFPLFKSAVRSECIMEPGDILFMPALWFHNVISLDFSIAINIFWKHLDDELYDAKDVYGNKDLIPASYAFQMLDKALKSLAKLPEPYRNFYSNRMSQRITDSLHHGT